MLRELQAAFRRGVLEGVATAILPALHTVAGPGADHRLAIHRNNTYASLVEVLRAAHPVVCRLVGTDFFAAAARRFIRDQPPTAPQLSAYGGGFAAFLEDFPPARAVPYLPDVARLEWARLEAHFAADAPPLEPSALAAMPPERCPDLVLELHPSVRLVASPYPIQRIWAANQPERATVPRIDLEAGGQAVLVRRPAATVEAVVLPPGERALLAALGDGRPLGAAAEAALRQDPGLDLQAALAAHLLGGTFRGFSLARSHEGEKA